MIKEYQQAIQDIETEIEKEFQPIAHPIFGKIELVEEEVQYLQEIVDDRDFAKYAHEDLCTLHLKDAYRKKIKGFHRAFNAKEQVSENPKGKR